jgi:3-oxoacyl-[acyl-carrier-protein] synthase II
MKRLSMSTDCGKGLRTIPVSSVKSMVGHTLSAAVAIETAFLLLTMQESVLPPTIINYDHPDPTIKFDALPNCARLPGVATLLCTSFGFGSLSACLVMACKPVSAARNSRNRRCHPLSCRTCSPQAQKSM